MKKLLLLAACIGFAATTFAQEKLTIDWPKEDKLKVATDQPSGQVRMVELIPEKETLDKWTLMGNTMSMEGVKLPSTKTVVDLFSQTAKQNAPDATVTVLESDDTAKNIWVLFKIESPKFLDDPKPESQLYYAIQGDTTLFVNFIAIKKAKLPSDFVTKWSKVFKASKLESK